MAVESEWQDWGTAEKAELRWRLRARPEQIVPDTGWSTLLWLAGRGWGKTRCLSEWVRQQATFKANQRVAVVAPTWADARDTMVEGHSGLLSVIPRDLIEAWNRSLGDLRLKNGSHIRIFSAAEPERLRGPQFHAAVCDELAAWTEISAWDMLLFALRLGENPRVAVATTPRPHRLLRELVSRAEEGDPATVVIRGKTIDNRENLSDIAVRSLLDRYEGTRLGRQELEGELLSEAEGALWREADIESTRIKTSWSHPSGADELEWRDLRIVVGYDPAASRPDDDRDRGSQKKGEDTRVRDERWSESGLVVVGVDNAKPPHVYVLEDASGRGSAEEMARHAIDVARRWGAQKIVVEKNNGGDWIPAMMRQVPGSDEVPLRTVWATKGKAVRAEPVAALWEQGRGHIVGASPELEEQMLTWVADAPSRGHSNHSDRTDAMVWAIWDLVIGPGGATHRDILTSPAGVTGPSYWRNG